MGGFVLRVIPVVEFFRALPNGARQSTVRFDGKIFMYYPVKSNIASNRLSMTAEFKFWKVSPMDNYLLSGVFNDPGKRINIVLIVSLARTIAGNLNNSLDIPFSLFSFPIR